MRRASVQVSALVLIAAAVPVLGAPGTARAAVAADRPGRSEVAQQRAAGALERHPAAVHAGAADAFRRRGATVLDADGRAHVRYDRTYRGLPVLGGDVVVHLAPDGSLDGTSTSLTDAVHVDVVPRVTSAAAERTGRSRFQGRLADVSARRVVDATDGAAALVWDVLATGVRPDQTPSRLHVLVDARTGRVRQVHDEIETGVGHGVYSGTVPLSTTRSGSLYVLKDPQRGGAYVTDLHGASEGGDEVAAASAGTGTMFTDRDDDWGTGSVTARSSAAVDAHYGAQETYDYYRDVLGRDGIFGDGKGKRSRVHYGHGYENAFWDGIQMTYGDGRGDQHPLTSLDIAGHEMSHGVTQSTANLDYWGEAGGLNEATSDIFGSMVEFAAANPQDPGDYRIGERIDLLGDGSPLRYLDRPSRDGESPDCWSRYLGELDPHFSSGPANHAFYLLAEGSGAKTINGIAHSSSTCNSSTVMGIGRTAAARIWYRALRVYMTSGTTYAGARRAAVYAAADLYGATSSRCTTVERAFSAIRVPGTTCASTLTPSGGLLHNPGFEQGSSSWTHSLGVIRQDFAAARTGSWLARLGGRGTAHTDTLSQPVVVPASASRTVLSFWLRVVGTEPSSAPRDVLRIQVRRGTSTTTLAAYSNRAVSAGYVKRYVDLSAYRGHGIRVTFTGTEDAGRATSFRLDDLALTTR